MRQISKGLTVIFMMILFSFSALAGVTFSINPLSGSAGQTVQTEINMAVTGGDVVGGVGFTLTAVGPVTLVSASAAVGTVVIGPTFQCTNANDRQVACQISGTTGTTNFGVIARIPLQIASGATGAVDLDLSVLSATDDLGNNLVVSNGGRRSFTIAAACVPRAATACVTGIECPSGNTIPALGCPASQSCQGSPSTCQPTGAACVPRAATACVTGIECPSGNTIPALGCPASQSCNAAGTCQLAAPGACTATSWECLGIGGCNGIVEGNQLVFKQASNCRLTNAAVCTNPDAVRPDDLRICAPSSLERLIGHLRAIIEGLQYTSETGPVVDYSQLETDAATAPLRKTAAIAKALVGRLVN